MKQRPRIYYTEEQKALMWDRWQKGESLGSIARLFDRYHSAIERIIREHGGIRPPERRRSPRALTLSERAVSLQVALFVQSHPPWVAHLRPSVGKSNISLHSPLFN